VEVSKIGRQIAEEVLDLQRRGEDSSSGSSPGPATESGLLNTEVKKSEFDRGSTDVSNYLSMIKIADHDDDVAREDT